MSRVLMIGYGPLSPEGLAAPMGTILRTRQFLKGVLEADHTVNLFTLPQPGASWGEDSSPTIVPDQFDGLHYQRFTHHSGEFAIETLQEQARRLEPEAIVGVNTYPSYVASQLSTTVPLWCDLSGLYIAEMQGRCWADQDDSRLVPAWAIERSILRRLDQFSAVTRPQLHAVLGEMATLGRLNRYTFSHGFGHHVPNAANAWEGIDAESGEPVLRGPIVPPESFIILWSGGFRLGSDVETLVQAMDDLMSQYSRVHFASTGGQIEGTDTRTYKRFGELVAESPYKERYHLLGWVPSEQLPQIYREADLGINVDAPNYETFFGARNRLNAMASAGLAIVTTLGTELSEWLSDGDAAITAPMGDPHALAAAIEPWIEQPEQLKLYCERAWRIMENDFSISHTTRALRAWLDEPALSPDNVAKMRQSGEEGGDLNSISINALEGQSALLENLDPRGLLRDRAQGQSFRQKPLNQFLSKMRRWMGE